MQISMYAVRVRFVADTRGPLDDKPRHVAITLARNHEEATSNVRARYAETERAGVVVEYQPPSHLPDTVALESMVFA